MGWRYRLDLQYDGTDFSGWQVQPGRRTVQGELEAGLARIGLPVRPVGAGRTDAGVHAVGAVAHVEVDREWEPVDLARALDSVTASDMEIRRVLPVDSSFHARYGAIARTYVYALGLSPDSFFRNRRWQVGALPDGKAATRELAGLLGEQDFAAFTKTGSDPGTTLCTLHEVRWDRVDGGALVTVSANRFLYGMVRALVGALLEGHRTGAPEGYLERVLATGDRGRAGAAAPAGGLYLARVTYPDDPGEADPAHRVARLAGLGPLESS